MLNAVTDNQEEVVITRGSRPAVVALPLSAYRALCPDVLRDRANARRLFAAVDRLQHGQGRIEELAE